MLSARRNGALLVLPVVLAIALLAGCASSPSHPIAKHSSAANRPTPSATPHAVTGPTGPVFLSCAEGSVSPSVWSLDGTTTRELASFTIPTTMTTTLGCEGPDTWRTVLAPQMFDKTFTRLAVNIHVSSDSSNHVGWIDRSGAVTDVTKAVSKGSDFSAVPQQTGALFDPLTGDFFYYDAGSKQGVWVDPSFAIAKQTPETADASHPLLFNAAGQLDGTTVPSSATACYPQTSPGGDKTFIVTTDTPGYAPLGDDSFVQLAMGRLEVVSADAPGTRWNQLPSAEQRFPCGKVGTPITPASDFTITSGAASKDGATVIFTARRGTSERTLFTVPSNGSTAPTKLASLPQDMVLIGWY